MIRLMGGSVHSLDGRGSLTARFVRVTQDRPQNRVALPREQSNRIECLGHRRIGRIFSDRARAGLPEMSIFLVADGSVQADFRGWSLAFRQIPNPTVHTSRVVRCIVISCLQSSTGGSDPAPGTDRAEPALIRSSPWQSRARPTHPSERGT